jgi:hypothetical protein
MMFSKIVWNSCKGPNFFLNTSTQIYICMTDLWVITGTGTDWLSVAYETSLVDTIKRLVQC